MQVNLPSIPFLTTLSIFLTIYIPLCQCYTYQIVFDTTSTTSYTNFNQDISQCSCDISITTCDTFCCCDNKCSTQKITQWNNNYYCTVNTVSIQRMCSNIGNISNISIGNTYSNNGKGLSSFQDLACIMYSNRGNIGNYYPSIYGNSFIQPTTSKFSSNYVKGQQKTQYSSIVSTKYIKNTPIRININNTSKQLLLLLSSYGQICKLSTIPLAITSYSSSCKYSINSQDDCFAINQYINDSTYSLCQYYNCSTNASTLITGNVTTIPTPIYNSITKQCSNIITNIKISINIGYNINTLQYKINNATIDFGTLSTGKGIININTNINIENSNNNVNSLSGNPGYIIGKNIKYATGNIYQFYNSNDNICLTTAQVNTSNPLNIKFATNQTFSCLTTNPCSSSLYIDKISLANNYTFLKYASQSSQSISITGLTDNTCGYQSIIIYILYSYSGWLMDKQYYILGSKIIGQTNVNGNIKMRQLRIKWILVQPTQIINPPTNRFYQYFQGLWLPLKSKFYTVTNYGKLYNYMGIISAIYILYSL